jgi:hypothetical protein
VCLCMWKFLGKTDSLLSTSPLDQVTCVMD